MSDSNIQNTTPVEVAKPFSMSIEGVPHIAVPKDFVVHPAENLLDHPQRDIRIVSVIDADSFKSYLDIHKTDRAAVHVNSQWPSANSSDYLACGYCDDADNVVTSWRDHQVKLDPLLSKDFVEWRDIDGKDLSQIELCRFLDRHLSNIVRPDDQPKAPTSSEVLTFVSNLSDVKKVEFKKSVNLDNGRVQLTYNELDAVALQTFRFRVTSGSSCAPLSVAMTATTFLPLCGIESWIQPNWSSPSSCATWIFCSRRCATRWSRNSARRSLRSPSF